MPPQQQRRASCVQQGFAGFAVSICSAASSAPAGSLFSFALPPIEDESFDNLPKRPPSPFPLPFAARCWASRRILRTSTQPGFLATIFVRMSTAYVGFINRLTGILNLLVETGVEIFEGNFFHDKIARYSCAAKRTGQLSITTRSSRAAFSGRSRTAATVSASRLDQKRT